MGRGKQEGCWWQQGSANVREAMHPKDTIVVGSLRERDVDAVHE
jgi:hypothetical protein